MKTIDRRATAFAGIASVAVLIFAALALGDAPASDDSAATVLADTSDHRTRILVAVCTIGLGLVLSLAFVAGLWAIARRTQRDSFWPAVAIATGIPVFATAATGIAVVGAIAYRSPDLSPESARLGWDVYAALVQASNVMTVAMAIALAVTLVADGSFARWVGPATVVVAVAHLVACFCWARSGAWSPTGVVAQTPGFVYLVWMAALSVALLRRADR